MQVNVTFRQIEATNALREHAEERVQRIAKYLHRPIDAHVVLSVVKHRHIAEIVLNADRTKLNAKEETDDLYSAIDQAADKLEQRVRKHVSKMKSHKRPEGARRQRAASEDLPVSPQSRVGLRMSVIRAGSVARRSGPQVIKSKRLPVKPMSVEEAVLQMDLMSSEFLVFLDVATDTLSVVYRRRDGDYGLITPDAS